MKLSAVCIVVAAVVALASADIGTPIPASGTWTISNTTIIEDGASVRNVPGDVAVNSDLTVRNVDLSIAPGVWTIGSGVVLEIINCTYSINDLDEVNGISWTGTNVGLINIQNVVMDLGSVQGASASLTNIDVSTTGAFNMENVVVRSKDYQINEYYDEDSRPDKSSGYVVMKADIGDDSTWTNVVIGLRNNAAVQAQYNAFEENCVTKPYNDGYTLVADELCDICAEYDLSCGGQGFGSVAFFGSADITVNDLSSLTKHGIIVEKDGGRFDLSNSTGIGMAVHPWDGAGYFVNDVSLSTLYFSDSVEAGGVFEAINMYVYSSAECLNIEVSSVFEPWWSDVYFERLSLPDPAANILENDVLELVSPIYRDEQSSVCADFGILAAIWICVGMIVCCVCCVGGVIFCIYKMLQAPSVPTGGAYKGATPGYNAHAQPNGYPAPGGPGGYPAPGGGHPGGYGSSMDMGSYQGGYGQGQAAPPADSQGWNGPQGGYGPPGGGFPPQQGGGYDNGPAPHADGYGNLGDPYAGDNNNGGPDYGGGYGGPPQGQAAPAIPDKYSYQPY